MALQQHLGHTGGVGKVGVDLEWRMRGEQIRVEAAALHAHPHLDRQVEQLLDEPVGPIAVAQAVHHIRPETKIQPKYSTNTGVPGAVEGQP